jgi:hypothetical protein
MHFEEINEPVEVISYFDGKKMRPLRFRWRSRAYHVTVVNGLWHENRGCNRVYHFHVSTKESGSFELVYDTDALDWRIGKVTIAS